MNFLKIPKKCCLKGPCTFGSWSDGPINAAGTVGSQSLKFAELTLVGARVNVLSVELCLQQFIQHNI